MGRFFELSAAPVGHRSQSFLWKGHYDAKIVNRQLWKTLKGSTQPAIHPHK